jgi:hypothetical protein
MFVLKLYYNNEIRRIALSEKVSFSTLTNLVKELFSSSKLLGNFVLKYLDNEEDVITVASDQELSEAFRLAQETKPAIIKFQVVPVASPVQPSSQKDCCNTRKPSCGFGYGRGFPHPAVCDSCNKRIFGLRFKCLNCSDYDLCSECTTIEGVHDKEHVRICFF